MVTGRSNPGDLPAGVDLLALVRRYEPVLCFTAGEQFFPMAVDDYLAQASLWAPDPAGREPATLLVDHRHLDAGRLAEAARARPGESLFLRYVPGGLSRRELRVWRRRPDRPKFTGVSRLAAVGLLGRFIDAGMRLSLTLRGRVPGGLAAAAQRQYAAGAPRYAYHAYVSTDGGYVVIQYWFLYAMNDWRSSFCGVNDHEGDWEQITVYLAPAGEPGSTRPGIDGLALAWIAFSSHDETGDDLRRRPDDPDLDWVDGTHPVCFAGAGSHSGAYLAGDYLVRVQPPALARVFAGARRIRSLLFPWTGHQPARGIDIPYVDYRRGDGVRIGPGTDRPWTPILVDSQTGWVRDYRGLWGLDTADPFGGERAPAGPRYERTGAIRASWADPVGWAGLDKVPPTPADATGVAAHRVRELAAHIDELDRRIADGRDRLRQAAAGVAALPASLTADRGRGEGTTGQLAAEEQAIAGLRARRRAASNERDQLQQSPRAMPGRHPHAHLRHRSVPDLTAPTGVLLEFWAGASLSVLLLLLGLALLLELGSVLWVTVAAVLIVTAVEALLRRRLLLFLLGLGILVSAAVLTWLLLTNLRIAFGLLSIIAAVAISAANLRTLLVKR